MRVNECNERHWEREPHFFSRDDPSSTRLLHTAGALCMSLIDSWEFDKRFTPRSVTKATTRTRSLLLQQNNKIHQTIFFSFLQIGQRGFLFDFHRKHHETCWFVCYFSSSKGFRFVLHNLFDAVQQILFDIARNRGCIEQTARIKNYST
jgi:hypothetical protein